MAAVLARPALKTVFAQCKKCNQKSRSAPMTSEFDVYTKTQYRVLKIYLCKKCEEANAKMSDIHYEDVYKNYNK